MEQGRTFRVTVPKKSAVAQKSVFHMNLLFSLRSNESSRRQSPIPCKQQCPTMSTKRRNHDDLFTAHVAGAPGVFKRPEETAFRADPVLKIGMRRFAGDHPKR
jgi:hypothetical protein